MKGLICIDIDGTLTAVRDAVSEDIINYLSECVQKGYEILFVTGRTFFWSMHVLDKMPFSFYLAVLNGAYIAHMPKGEYIAKQYLSYPIITDALSKLEKVDIGIVLYMGPDSDQKGYFCSEHASTVIVNHLEKRQKALKERWECVANFKDIPHGHYAAVRLFCLPHTAKELSYKLDDPLSLHAPMMTDSYDKSFSIVQLTHAKVSKGHALDVVKKHIGSCDFVVACGDDYNDISMLKKADCAVVMNTAPADVLILADIIAPAAKENGLMTALQRVLKF
jgi:Cof subfamily protein (haloacid dehalogenase superfamily)